MYALTCTIALALIAFAAAFLGGIPHASQALLPLYESTNEYTALAVALLITIPGLALLTVVLAAAAD